MGEEFSKSALDRYRKTGQPLKCKQCVAAAEKAERDAAASMRSTTDANAEYGDHNPAQEEVRQCAGACRQQLPQSSFNRNQWGKGEGKSRCRSCVEQCLQDEHAQQTQSKQDKIDTVRAKVEKLKSQPSSKASEIVAAESELAALEAEKVTGLKPIRLGSGRGRGRGRSGGGGRGRGAAGRATGRGK